MCINLFSFFKNGIYCLVFVFCFHGPVSYFVGPLLPLRFRTIGFKARVDSPSTPLFSVFLSTGSGRHSDAAHEIRLIGCCVLLNVVPKTVPLSGSSWSPLNCLLPFGRLASLEAMRLFMYLVYTWIHHHLYSCPTCA